MRYAVTVELHILIEAGSEYEATQIGQWIGEGIPSTQDAVVEVIEVTAEVSE